MYRKVFPRQNQRRAPALRAELAGILLLFLAPGGWLPTLSAQDATPTIELTTVPPYGSLELLRGRVANVTISDHRVAVYILVPPYGWWNRPSPSAPITTINADGTWECDITTVELDQYATKILAFLIPATYQPPLMESHLCLPDELYQYPYAEAVRCRTTVFANCDWTIQTAFDPIDPGPNYFSDSEENVWVDTGGSLHLKVAQRAGAWYCSDVRANRSLGYGRYAFTVTGAVDRFDPNVVLQFFTWQDCQRDQFNREMDVQLSRWSNPTFPNARFTVQPWFLEENQHTFNVDTGLDPNGTMTHEFTWEPNAVSFQSYYGRFALHPDAGDIAGSWRYAGPNVPVPDQENVRMNLWLANQLPPADNQDVEVAVNNVLFLPFEPNAVYRFWSPVNLRHFYTISPSEKEKLEQYYSQVWTYEGIVYYTPARGGQAGLAPVYRFWSDQLLAHFYTIKEKERDKLINQYASVWSYEGPAFYAWPDGQQPPGTVPVYRFWSDSLQTHFYTAKEGEKNKIINQYPDVWTYEGVAWHSYPVSVAQ